MTKPTETPPRPSEPDAAVDPGPLDIDPLDPPHAEPVPNAPSSPTDDPAGIEPLNPA